MTSHCFVDYAYDSLGNIAGVRGVWNVPDDFEPEATYATFCAEFIASHRTKTGRLTARQRLTQERQWTKYLDKRYERVSHSHRE